MNLHIVTVNISDTIKRGSGILSSNIVQERSDGTEVLLDSLKGCSGEHNLFSTNICSIQIIKCSVEALLFVCYNATVAAARRTVTCHLSTERKVGSWKTERKPSRERNERAVTYPWSRRRSRVQRGDWKMEVAGAEVRRRRTRWKEDCDLSPVTCPRSGEQGHVQ